MSRPTSDPIRRQATPETAPKAARAVHPVSPDTHIPNAHASAQFGHSLSDFSVMPPFEAAMPEAMPAGEAAPTAPLQRKANKTGLPDALKSGIEGLSGLALDDVNVHYNSDRPAGMGALAYAQGTDIHLGAGQEPHLGHEAWHVVQQKQGRVHPTLQAAGQPVNDDAGLEAEADAMGGQALGASAPEAATGPVQRKAGPGASGGGVIQAKITRGAGWAGRLGFTWVDNDAAAIWDDLDKKFGGELATLKSQLDGLRSSHTSPVAQKHLGPAITAVQSLLTNHDSQALDYANAKALQLKVNTAVSAAESAKTKAGEAEQGHIAAQNVLKQRQQQEKIAEIEQMLEDLPQEGSKAVRLALNAAKEVEGGWQSGEKAGLVSQVQGLKDKAEQARRMKADKLALEQGAEMKKQQDKVEAARIAEEAKRLRERLKGSYQPLLTSCGGDVDKLSALVQKSGSGDPGKLVSILTFVSPEEWEQINAVHGTGHDQLNKLLTTVGEGRAGHVKAMLQKIKPGEVPQLTALLERTGGDEGRRLPALLGKAKIGTISTLLSQAGDDPTKVNALFGKAGVKVDSLEALLATDFAAHVTELIEQLPDTDTLLKLMPTVATALELKLLAADLTANPAGLTGAKALLERGKDSPTLKDELYGAANPLGEARPGEKGQDKRARETFLSSQEAVRKARGLQTDAGETIATCGIADYNEQAQKAINATLAHIRGGKQPTLSHPNGAKFGESHENRDGLLPGVRGARGYKEYYVEKAPGDDDDYHGSRRLVVSDTTGHIYYTNDHYASFKRLLA